MTDRNTTVELELQELCDSLLDDATQITWDLYRQEDYEALELKIRLALYPKSVTVGEDGTAKIIPAALDNKEDLRMDILAKHVTEKVWDQRKHTDNDLRMSIVYIALAQTHVTENPLKSSNFLIRPLFRTMKCIDPVTKSAHGKCMVFVDEFGWVYQNWKEFMLNTLYPDTMIVAPEKGVFMRNAAGTVQLMYFKAPMTADEIKARQWTNVGLTVTGLASTAVLGAAAFFPITAPFVWGAAIIGGAVASVSGYQSISELVRRNTHEQSLSLADEEARAHWLSISGTILGFAAAGASGLVRGAAAAGTVSKSVVYASNTVFISSMAVNGVAVGNGFFTVATTNRDVTTAEVLQLSVSLFLFTHSVYNFRTAQTVIRETQTQHLADYKQTLSKNGQKNFQKKMNARTRQLGSETQARGDTIRNLNTADHYNNNFKGTAAFQSSTTLTEDPSLFQKLGKIPVSQIALFINVCKIAAHVKVEDYWRMLNEMADMILNRFLNCNLTIEAVIGDIVRLIKKEASRKNVKFSDICNKFQGSYETIPDVVRTYFQAFDLTPGPLICTVCAGRKYL